LGLGAYASVIRPLNCAMIGLAVIVGYFVSKPPSAQPLVIAMGFLTGFTICAYSMVINDYYDIEVDRVNQPMRPLPSGRVTPRAAIALSLVMLLVGTGSSLYFAFPVAPSIALLYALLSWVYNFRVKKQGLLGNLIVASSLAIPFIYGGVISSGDVGSSLLLFMALTSFLSGVGREVVKAMADTAGDAKRGIRSYAIVHGLKAAASVGAIFFLAAVVTSVLPLFLLRVSDFYRFGVVVPDLVFLYLAVAILSRPTLERALSVKRTALFGMLIGLIVFVGGAF
jgi:geranylgeranylglycerol-phosphate geranylgeranyltransferase